MTSENTMNEKMTMAYRASRKIDPGNFTRDSLGELKRIDPDCLLFPLDDRNEFGLKICFSDGSCAELILEAEAIN
jgi:hypothetical protein